MISVSFSASGAARSKLDRYWLVMHSIVVFPPVSLPEMVIGALSFALSAMAVAPRSVSDLSSGPMGRLWICWSPVSVMCEFLSARAAEAAAIRSVVPEFATSMADAGVWISPPLPVICHFSWFLVLISAPNAA